MPYLLLILGILIGLFVLYNFLIKANAAQVRMLILSMILVGIGLAAFVLAVTGRLPAAIALMAVCVPFGVKYLKNRAKREDVSTIIEVEAEEIEDDDDNDDAPLP